MIDIDSQVRDTLADHASEAPGGGDLLSAVHARSRRYTIRRRTVLGGVAASVVAVLSTAVIVASAGPPSTLEPAKSPEKSRIVLAPWADAPEATKFPLTPGWLPPGAKPPVVHGSGDFIELIVDVGDTQAFVLAIGSKPASQIDGTKDAVRKALTVNGKKAELLTPEMQPEQVSPIATLSVERTPGQWVRIVGLGENRHEAVLTRVAANLRDKPLAASSRLTFAVYPEGYLVSVNTPAQVVFRRADAFAGADRVDEFRVHYRKLHNDDGRRPDAESVQVNGRQAWLRKTGFDLFNPEDPPLKGAGEPHRYLLEIHIENGQYLRVEGPGSPELSREDFLRFAAGITVPPGLTVGT